MNAPDAVLRLVERFDQNAAAYRSGHYNEAQVRVDFINPLFEALGWDITNKRGLPEDQRDVIYEDAIKVRTAPKTLDELPLFKFLDSGGDDVDAAVAPVESQYSAVFQTSGGTKAPDYGFRVGGARKFFLEAKKPSVNIKGDVHPAFQLRRYGWSANLPLSILTDFEELAVYDCRVVPKRDDKAATARTKYLTYTEYADRWDELYALFSREAVLSGQLDMYAEAAKTQKGIATVDAAFLREIETWRADLAHNIAVWNKDLNQRELNFAVQMTLDRIIFLRICEDRGIEPYGRLQALREGGQIYTRLGHIFQQSDARYNSGLFHFKPEKGRTDDVDDWTLKLYIEDEPLNRVIKNLYFPDSPYEFSVLPIELLGQVYEQFLGKVIHLTSDRRSQVEEKPEVRKAGGVYYTPSYIVDYIVKNTIGKLLEEKSPKQAAKIRIVDPACGSGSFLIGAYQFLLDWHREQYLADGVHKHKRELYQASGGAWRLTTAERKRILLNNIFGVDIDTQAVEVTKLSLLLKVLEGETDQTLASQLRLVQERALPDLGNNIKSGNSLIGPDFYEHQQMHLFDENEVYRINAFDWQAEFPKIMEAGGFDAVIGNPPYVRTINLTDEKTYYKRKYFSAVGAYDIYVLFMEKALKLVNSQSGLVGFITPNKFFVADYAKNIRKMVLDEGAIIEIADLGKCKSVFVGALISTAVTIYTRSRSTKEIRLKILSDNTVKQISDIPEKVVPKEEIVTPEGHIRVYQDTNTNSILEKIILNSRRLSDVAQVRTGVMGFDYWAMDKCISDENAGRRIATNSYIDRYAFLWGKKVRLYKREVFDPKLDENCDVLSQNTLELFSTKKLVVRGVARRLTAMLDQEGVGLLVAVHSVVGKHYDNKFLLGLLNSKLFNWIHIIQFYSARIPEGSLRYPISFLENLHIRNVDLDNIAESAIYKQICELVERMLALHKQLASVKTSYDRSFLQRQFDATDNQIDRLVYELYELTEDEIRIVEASTTNVVAVADEE